MRKTTAHSRFHEIYFAFSVPLTGNEVQIAGAAVKRMRFAKSKIVFLDLTPLQIANRFKNLPQTALVESCKIRDNSKMQRGKLNAV